MLAASIPTGFGVWVQRFTFPIIGIHQVPSWVGVPLTVLGIVAVMNMVNFLDGLDGLAAGVCAISGATFSIIELSLGRIGAAVLAAIVCGACLGFLRHNFYPARIFMGDSGALLLGFTLAVDLGPGPAEDGGVGDPAAAAARAGRARARHVVRRREAATERPADLQGRRAAPAPPLHATRLLAAPRRRLPLGVVRDTRDSPRSRRHFAPPHQRGDWNLTNVVIDVVAGLLALAFSLYVVYVLELVKLTSPRAPPSRRRSQGRLSIVTSDAWRALS